MKATLNRLLLALFAVATLTLPGLARPQVSAEVSFETGLAPYGEWVDIPHRGRVWRPRHAHAGWRPYFHGRWVWTDDGWYWDSDEPWSWAVYHYGRWDDDPVYGWVWAPGSVWAPAWVTWRFGGGAIGWAPLFPGFSVWWAAGYPVQYSAWVFAPERQFVGVNIEGVAYSPSRSAAFFSTTRPAPPRSAGSSAAPRLGGPPRTYVEHQIGRPIAPVHIAAAATPQAARGGGRGGAISVYRPPHAATARWTAQASAARSTTHGATAPSTRHAAAARSAQRTPAARSAPHASTAHPAHTATAHSAQHAPAARSAPHASTAHPAHTATAHSAQHAPAARSAPHASTAHPAHTAAARSESHAARSAPHAATASSGPRNASAPHQEASGPAPREQARAAPQRSSLPAQHSGPQPQGSPRSAPARQAKTDSGHRSSG